MKGDEVEEGREHYAEGVTYDLRNGTSKSDAFVAKISEPSQKWTTTYTYTLCLRKGQAYDIANRLTSVDGVTYILHFVQDRLWDNNGNLLSDGVNTYSYDHANRLISVVGPSTTSSYAYNGLGDRLQQTVDSVTEKYAPSRLQLSVQLLKP